jgi:hypothetical protein
MRKIIRSDELRVSERVVIRKGDKFRASGGPYWKGADGQKMAMKASGPYTFLWHCKKGRLEWVECGDKDGASAVLHIAGKRKSIVPGLVCRPYKITSKKRAVVRKPRREITK